MGAVSTTKSAPDELEARNALVASTFQILRVVTGSTAYGTAIKGASDRDEKGVVIPTPEQVIGMHEYIQHDLRSARQGERSQAGDTDVTVYSLRRFVNRVTKGSPNHIEMLFTPPELQTVQTVFGAELLEWAPQLLSKQVGKRFAGYMRNEQQRLEKTKNGQHTNRPELVEQYGFDTKAAYHLIRVGFMGLELMKDQRITLPMNPPARELLIGVRTGKHTLDSVLGIAAEVDQQLQLAIKRAQMRDCVDMAKLDRWLVGVHYQAWELFGLL